MSGMIWIAFGLNDSDVRSCDNKYYHMVRLITKSALPFKMLNAFEHEGVADSGNTDCS